MISTSFNEIDLKNIRGVLLDLDNTVYTYKPCHEKALRATFESLNEAYACTFEEFLRLYKEAQESVKSRTKQQAASHSRFLYLQAMIENVLGTTDIKKVLQLEKVYWDSFRETMVIREEAMDFLTTCKEKKISICLITDLTSQIQFSKVVKLGIENMITFVVTSEEVGVEKPDPKIFDYALKKIGLTKKEVIVIGDDEMKDIHGAQDCNITAYLVK
jgi:putative hydrolase of the HAD superfamily